MTRIREEEEDRLDQMVNHLVKSVKPALSLLKLYSTTASVHSTDTGHSPRHLYQDHLSAGEHVRDVIGKS